MGNIDWLPIAEIPDLLKDGREVLAWDSEFPEPHIVRWNLAAGVFWNDEGVTINPSHAAEINPPH